MKSVCWACRSFPQWRQILVKSLFPLAADSRHVAVPTRCFKSRIAEVEAVDSPSSGTDPFAASWSSASAGLSQMCVLYRNRTLTAGLASTAKVSITNSVTTLYGDLPQAKAIAPASASDTHSGDAFAASDSEEGTYRAAIALDGRVCRRSDCRAPPFLDCGARHAPPRVEERRIDHLRRRRSLVGQLWRSLWPSTKRPSYRRHKRRRHCESRRHQQRRDSLSKEQSRLLQSTLTTHRSEIRWTSSIRQCTLFLRSTSAEVWCCWCCDSLPLSVSELPPQRGRKTQRDTIGMLRQRKFACHSGWATQSSVTNCPDDQMKTIGLWSLVQCTVTGAV